MWSRICRIATARAALCVADDGGIHPEPFGIPDVIHDYDAAMTGAAHLQGLMAPGSTLHPIGDQNANHRQIAGNHRHGAIDR
jgi:hypothetical protein